MFDKDDPQSLEKYSSAVTLSDMEVFIFPELLYALSCANIMSPLLWKWKADPWFSKIENLNPQRRVQRLKQYIMDNFSFNLDLDTWGLTTKQKELSRFSSFISEDILARSNALFGYEGDKYYFDIDIRKHFGLDKYNTDVIPYWKTETVEAMQAFRYKENYGIGAGECVSLAALYASAAFVVAEVPLDDIYMMATPLHSQNFLNIGDGIITNNRRIVTKTMWFNGTELSAKARRAIENERITIVAHRTGYVHAIYPDATISRKSFLIFRDKLHNYLETEITFELLANFLRQNSRLQCCFQIAHKCCGKPRYIGAEEVYAYEHSSKSRVGDNTQNTLLHEIEEDEFYTEPLQGRLILGELEKFFLENRVVVNEKETIEKLKQSLKHNCFNVENVVHDLINFCNTQPKLPDQNKKWVESVPIDLNGVKSPDEALEYLESIRKVNTTADLAFTSFRDLSRSAWKPFIKAAIERNPVSILAMSRLDIEQTYNKLASMKNQSIYEGVTRMAQPDEVWNYSRGDGLEKAITFINILKNRYPQETFAITGGNGKVGVVFNRKTYTFESSKKLELPQKDDF